ncbi:hypothetical protein CRE_22611 [Caenorhabditis remanei]|uniref:Uncharacterized protein n=1 Tax=Caenorhabditis remanei TaxID=31234 RepID=E3N8P6_CAERE|nr:hypothetical protein CRE_22611 [Caenorhabditis remanei]
MKTQPLRYQSLKVVLLYMEADVRQVSLKYSAGTSINDTNYYVGIYRDFQPDQAIPKIVENENKIGVPYNLDQYGFQAPPNYILAAGDVPLADLNNDPLRHDTDEVEESEKRSLRNYEAALTLKNKSMDTEAAVEELPENDNQDVVNNAVIRQLSNYSVEILNELILLHRHALLPFHYRRHNLTPPYSCYIQLTVASKGTKPRIQRYMYTKRLHEAAKQLNTILFGGRQCVIQVRDFTMPWCSILRLPVGFKIRVKCIDDLYDLSLKYNAMLSMIDSSSFPLDKITIHSTIDVGIGANDYHLPAIRSAKVIKIQDDSFEPGLLTFLRTVPNQTVIVSHYYVLFHADDYFALVTNWLTVKRPAGTCYLFPIWKEETVRELLKLVKTRIENTKRTKRRVTVCMGHSNRLEVYYVPAKSLNNPGFNCHGYKWILNMRVVSV